MLGTLPKLVKGNMSKILKRSFLCAAISLSSVANASAETVEDDYDADYNFEYANATDINDPLEELNRAIFSFNSVVDDYFLEPVATGYDETVPEWGQNRVSNFLSNLTEPVTLVNATLQAKDEKAFTSLWRFLINTTFGVLGTFDAASEVGLKKDKETFGETLYSWGLTESPYLVLPFMGPTTLRDAGGDIIDFYINPFNYNEVLDSNVRLPIYVTNVISTRADLLPVTKNLDSTALDRYATYRSAYYQNFESQAQR